MTTSLKSVAPPLGFVLGLGLLASLGPFSIDMFLPSLPEIGRELGISSTSTQLMISIYLLVLGLAQLFVGPITDAVGRRRPLITGLVLFIAGSALAALAPDFTVLLVARALQGAGGALALVVANSSVRDRTHGPGAVKLFALLMTVAGLGPIIAPVLGGLLESTLGWRSVFWLMGVIAVASVFVSLRHLPESLPHNARTKLHLGSIMRGYASIATTRAFLLPALAIGSSFMMLFAYIGGASIVYQEIYGLTPAMFGLVFGASGIAVLAGAQVSSVLAHKVSARRSSLSGAVIMLLGAAVALVSTMLGGGLLGIVVGVALLEFGLGAAEPSIMTIAMSSGDSNLGSRAALLGAIQFGMGALATPFVGLVLGDNPIGWLLLLVAFGVLTLALLAIHFRFAPSDVSLATTDTTTRPITLVH
ncbi:multidrug effflux MFS transporter [Salinibacterium sp. M195]|uniref:multidrug effflux MFS transporter n=1 Tax=Salinibacterium sp. M195 TaxID=2583374 RepID=UPI001C635BB0|nr:multidrug effflux MFS transporter [Salinibacterium sp. M195]QYH36647.1 multidrug effflux MFS transporter [Salinibacterium sp. M195]